tara:strand:+ start:536 stop:790 length:255 start_codon:yes stop_codon:yes gene_type:complete
MKSIILFSFAFVITLFFSFSDVLADQISGELSNDLSMELKSKNVNNDIYNNGDKGDIPKASNEDIFGDEQAFPFIAGLGKNAAH